MKMKAGKLYDANYDPELLAERAACADLTYELNQLRPSKAEERDALVRRILVLSSAIMATTSRWAKTSSPT